MTRVTLTEAQIRAGLLSPFSLSAAQFTYSIANGSSTWGDYAAGEEPTKAGYSILSLSQADAFRLAMAAWDRLILRNFTEITETAATRGEIRAAFTDMEAGTAAYAYQGGNQTPTSKVGDVWINSTTAGASFAQGTNNYITLLHEIGHAIGLKHSFEGTQIPAPYQNGRYTVMSYTTATPIFTLGFNISGNSISTTSQRVVVTTPMVLDIAAAQYLYGADPNTATGDTTYTFTQGDTSIIAIYDAGGTDTIDLSNFTRDNIIDLEPGAYSSVGFWTEAQQQAFYQSQTPVPSFDDFIAEQYATTDAYEWRDNVGIALGTVIENAIGGSGNDTITGNAVANRLEGRGGNDTLNGEGGNDLLFAGAGTDTLNGGEGNDGFLFGAEYTAADTVNGGGGALDQLGLQGNYSGGVTLGAMTGVEFVVLLAGDDNRFGGATGTSLSYNLIATNATVTAGALLTVQANTLRLGENFSFNGAAELDGSFLIYGGLGTDILTGGSGNDGFFFGQGRFSSADQIVGGAGTLDQVGFQGNFTGGSAIVFGAAQLSGVETVVLLSASDTRFGASGGTVSYSVTMADGNTLAGQRMVISANSLKAGETLSFNGSAETDGSFRIFAGAGNDAIVGSARGDEIYGGLGNDIFGYTAAGQSTLASQDTIADFAAGDKIHVGTLGSFTFIGSAAQNGAGQVRVVQAGNQATVEVYIDGDSTADLVIGVTVADSHLLTAADFTLSGPLGDVVPFESADLRQFVDGPRWSDYALVAPTSDMFV